MSKRYFKNVSSDCQQIGKSHDFWKDKVHGLVELISKNALSSPDNDLYTGTTGIAYMFYCLSETDTFKNDSTTYKNKAIEIIQFKKNSSNRKTLSQFICGDAGVNAVNAAIYNQIGDERMSEMYLQNFRNGAVFCKPIDFFKPGGDELFVGRAGYLYGVLWLENIFGRKIIPEQDIIELCSTIVESGRKYTKRNKSVFPLMYSYYNTEYLGKRLYCRDKNCAFNEGTYLLNNLLILFRSCSWFMHNSTSIDFISSVH